jgi:ribosomal protein S18 acetylase RimI-like enzyme
LWVEPRARGYGLGRLLVERVMSEFPDRRIDVYVVRSNESRKFYEAIGFKMPQHWCLYRHGE